MGTYATKQRYDNRHAAVGTAVLISYGPQEAGGVLHAGTIAWIRDDSPVFDVAGLDPSMLLATNMEFVATRTEGDVSALRGGTWTWAAPLLIGVWTRTPPLCPECGGDQGAEEHNDQCSQLHD